MNTPVINNKETDLHRINTGTCTSIRSRHHIRSRDKAQLLGMHYDLTTFFIQIGTCGKLHRNLSCKCKCIEVWGNFDIVTKTDIGEVHK